MKFEVTLTVKNQIEAENEQDASLQVEAWKASVVGSTEGSEMLAEAPVKLLPLYDNN